MAASRVRWCAIGFLAGVPLTLEATVPEAVLDDLLDKAASEGPVRVIVELDTDFMPEGLLTASARRQQAQGIEMAQARVAAALAGPDVREVVRFRSIPFAVYAAEPRGLRRLSALAEVVGIQEDIPEAPTLASSTGVIGAPVAWANGYTGAGQVIAILDTGVDANHPYFSAPGKIAAEGCYSSNVSSQIVSMCPGGVAASTAAGSGANCPPEVRGCHHGTHVAGIAAGDDGQGPNTGVARAARLIPIMVFTRFNSQISCNNSAPCALSYVSDQILGLERVLELAPEQDIAAVNISIGGAAYSSTSSCDQANAARKAAIDNLRSAGIATIASAGNNGYTAAISQPACISSAISAGATTDDDLLASYSNVANFIDLLAPGSEVVSSVPGGGTQSINGTSMSAPHVTAAWAVLRQASPSSTVEQILAVLREPGTLVDDLRSGGTVTGMRRINLDLSLIALGAIVPDAEDGVFSNGFEATSPP